MKENKKEMEWAARLGCSVQQVRQYKKILKHNFLPCIEWDEIDREFYFALYQQQYSPSGKMSLVTIMTGGIGFNSQREALEDARTNIMPGINLEKTWAAAQNIPVNAIQMMNVCMR